MVAGWSPASDSRSILTALGLYVLAALLIGYFGVNAYHRQSRAARRSRISTSRSRRSRPSSPGCKSSAGSGNAASRLLQAQELDPDMLDERARALLDYAHPNDLTLMLEHAPACAGRRLLN